jgi:hypothetical protein
LKLQDYDNYEIPSDKHKKDPFLFFKLFAKGRFIIIVGGGGGGREKMGAGQLSSVIVKGPWVKCF